MKINRKVIWSNATNLQLHGFCNSSERAYGACLYIRSTDNKTSCEFPCSTSNVAPLKQIPIPRLELCVATLLTKLYKKATCALNMKIDKSYLWTDPSIILTWIQGPPNKWKEFVGKSRQDTIRNRFSNLEACANSIQSCWSHLKRDRLDNAVQFYFVVAWTTTAVTGALQLAFNRVQHANRWHGNQKRLCCTSTTSRRRYATIL
jgi:hypothetical protein